MWFFLKILRALIRKPKNKTTASLEKVDSIIDSFLLQKKKKSLFFPLKRKKLKNRIRNRLERLGDKRIFPCGSLWNLQPQSGVTVAVSVIVALFLFDISSDRK